MFIKQSKSSEMFYAEHLSESERLQEIVKKGEAHHYAMPDISQDIFSLLYDRKPEDEEGPMPLGLRICKQALDKIKELREFQDLKRLCSMDAFASGIATIAMDKAFMEFVPKMPESPEQLRQKAEAAIELGMNETAVKLEIAAEKANAYLNKIDPRILDDETCRQKVRAALQQAMEQTKDAVEGMSAFGCDDSEGQIKQVSLKEKMELAKALRNSKKLKEIAKLAGRFIAIAKKKQREIMRSTEISSVKMGNDIPYMLPTELGKLSNPDLAPLFYKGYVEKTLLQYDLHARKPTGQGDIIVCVDTSGSTMGYTEIAEKAIAMALLEIAKLQKRGFVLINFSSTNQIRVFEAPGGKYKNLELLFEIEHAWQGGTSFESPLSKALEYIEKNKYPKSDIIFLTDGCADISPKFLENYNRIKKDKEFSCIGMLIGHEAAVLQSFTDELFHVNDLLSDEQGNDDFQERTFKI